MPQTVWGVNTPYATALLTAHMLSTSGPQGRGPTGGVLTSEQVGDLSRSFGTCFEPKAGDAVLRTTTYGIDFIALRKETFTKVRRQEGGSDKLLKDMSDSFTEISIKDKFTTAFEVAADGEEIAFVGLLRSSGDYKPKDQC